MGIFDIFKTKVTDAADKTGDIAGETKDKAEGMMGRGEKTEGEAAAPTADAATDVQAGAENMVSEGAPAMEAPAEEGAAGMPTSDGSGGMTGTIKDNVASGADKAGEMADNATGNKYTDQINTGVDKAKDMLGKG